jgi:hypothetical protein
MHRSHSGISLLHPAFSPTRPSKAGSPSFSIGAGGEALSCTTTSHYASLVDDRGGNLEEYRVDAATLKSLPKKLRRFYEGQNELLDAYAEVDAVLDDTVVDTYSDIESSPLLPRNRREGEEAAESRRVKWAININLVINVLLLSAKIVAVLMTDSVSLIAGAVDSAMDLLSTVIIAGTAFLVARRDWKSDCKLRCLRWMAV